MSNLEEFGEGLITGFTKSLGARLDKNQKLEDDLLRNNISNWESEKKKTSEKNAKDAALVKQAKGIVANTKLPVHVSQNDAISLVANELMIYEDPKFVAERFASAIQRGAFINNRTELAPVTSVDTEMSSIITTGGAADNPDSIEKLDTQFKTNLNSMMANLPEDLKGRVEVYSGYRDANYQAKLIADNMPKYGFSKEQVSEWQKEVSENGVEAATANWTDRFNQSGIRKFVALPGTSKHQQGIAADLKLDGQRLDYADANDITRIHEIAEKHGLYFRMAHEPWQVELRPDAAKSATTSTLPDINEQAVAESEELGLGARFSQGLKTVLGLDRNFYINNANERFKDYLVANNEMALYDAVRTGTKSIVPASGLLSYDTTIMAMDIQEPPALSSVDSQDDIDAIRAQIKAFSIPLPDGYDAALTELETKFATLTSLDLPKIQDIDSKGKAIATYNAMKNLNDTQIKELPEGYKSTVESIYAAYEDSGQEKLTRGYIATQYYNLSEAAKSGDQDAVAAFNIFKNSTMPSMLTAIEAANPSDPKIPELADLFAKKQLLQSATTPDTNEINKIDQQIENVLAASRAEALAKDTKTVEIIVENEDGTWSATEVRTDPSGNGYQRLDGSAFEAGEDTTIHNLDPSLLKERQDALSVINKESPIYQNRVENLQNALGDAFTMFDAASTEINDQAFAALKAPKVAEALKGVNALQKEAAFLIDILQSETSGNKTFVPSDSQDVMARLERLETLIAEAEATPQGTLQTVAQARDIMNAKAVLMTFRIGGLEGQSGQAMSNRDFDRLRTTFETNNPVTYRQLLGEYLTSHVAAIQKRHASIVDNVMITSWENRAGIDFFGGADKLKTFEEVMDENATDIQKAGYKFFVNKSYEMNPSEQTSTTTNETKIVSETDTHITYTNGTATWRVAK